MSNTTWKLFLAAAGVLTLAYIVVDGMPLLLDGLWVAATLVGLVAVMLGIRLHRPRPARPWWLLSVSLACFAVASLLDPYSLGFSPSHPRALVGDGLVFVGYLLVGAVGLRIVRHQTPDGDRDGVIDGVIVMVAITTVLWTVMYDAMSGASTTQMMVNAISPLVSAGVTAACVRLVFTSGARQPAALLLATGGFLAFVGSIGWMLLLQSDTYAPGSWSDALLLAAVLLAGISALHPSMVELTRPVPGVQDAVSAGRLTVLGLALVATPAALLALANAVTVHIALPVAGSAVLALLVLVRLGRLVADRERGRREIEIREARQAAVSALAAEALTDRAVADLYDVASELVAGQLDDVAITVTTVPDGHGDVATGLDDTPTDRLRLAVMGTDGPTAFLQIESSPSRGLSPDDQDFLTAITNILASAVQRRQAEDLLRQRALHDALTGLPNRSLLLELLHRTLAQRTNDVVGLAFIDLDGFKIINDTHGHDAGDRVLLAVAGRMREAVRAGDTVARLAGDEFVVVTQPCREDELHGLAERLLAAVTAPIDLDGTQVSVGASIGTTQALPGQRAPEEMLRSADQAMYVAKAAGGRRIAANDDTAAPAPQQAVRP